MRNNIIAIMYDFDKTLCAKDMQEYTFIPNLGMDSSKFWNEATELRITNKMDQGCVLPSGRQRNYWVAAIILSLLE